MNTIVVWLFLFSCASLLGLWISGYFVARGQKQQERRAARLRMLRTPQSMKRLVIPSSFVQTNQVKWRSSSGIIGLIAGVDPGRFSQYPVPWWGVMIFSLAAGKLAQTFLSEMLGTASWLLIPSVGVGLTRYIFNTLEQRRRQRAILQLPDFLDQIVRGVRVGLPVLEAIRAAVRDASEPTRTEFARLVDQVAVGMPLEDAVAEMAQRCALPEYSFFSTVVALQHQTGGALSEALNGLADVVRKRVAIIEKGKALSSEAKATAVVLSALPFVMAGLMWIVNASYINLLFDEPMGHTMLAAAAVFLTLGLLTIRALFRKALSLT